MNESVKPILMRKLVRESCFGTYVVSPTSYKSYMLTQMARDIVKILDGKKTISELIDLVGSSHRLDSDAARKQVNAVINELQKLGALQLE